MTLYVLELVPIYGLIIVFFVVMIACLAVPLPASMLVLASGGFVASGDLVLWEVLLVAFGAYVIGDQIAFHLAQRVGTPLLDWLRRHDTLATPLNKGETLLRKRGTMAIFLSHTILSPTCPYVCFICGATHMRWPAFTATAVIGAAVWSTSYVTIGYYFAGQISQVSDILNNLTGVVFAGLGAVGCILWLRRS